MSVEVDWEIAYLPWFEYQSDPRQDLERRAEEPIECELCGTELAWRDMKNAACESCGRRVPAGTADADHLFAKNYTITVRK